MIEAEITLENVTARQAPVALAPTTFTLGAGIHAFIGTREDGVGLALAILAGRAPVRSGVVRVLGGAPASRAIAKSIAHVGREVVLPEVMRVGEVMAMAARLRGQSESDARVRLEQLGVAELLPRRVSSLLPSEARAVALAEALTSSAPRAPLGRAVRRRRPRAPRRVSPAAIRARASDACVVVATASVREASDLATIISSSIAGASFIVGPRSKRLTARVPSPARLRATVEDPRTLLAALAAETAPTSIQAGPRTVTISGPDVLTLAEAMARASLRANVEIASLRADAPVLEELRASLAGRS